MSKPVAPLTDAAQVCELGEDVARKLMAVGDWSVLVDKVLTRWEREDDAHAQSQ